MLFDPYHILFVLYFLLEQGYKVIITPNTKPEEEMLTSLVKIAHGQVSIWVSTSGIFAVVAWWIIQFWVNLYQMQLDYASILLHFAYELISTVKKNDSMIQASPCL